MELGTLQIINGDFQFDNTDRPYSKKSGFDPAHFRLKELNTDISIDYASKELHSSAICGGVGVRQLTAGIPVHLHAVGKQRIQAEDVGRKHLAE